MEMNEYEMSEYDYYIETIVAEFAEIFCYSNSYEYLNGMHQRFTLPNGMRITF